VSKAKRFMLKSPVKIGLIKGKLEQGLAIIRLKAL